MATTRISWLLGGDAQGARRLGALKISRRFEKLFPAMSRLGLAFERLHKDWVGIDQLNTVDLILNLRLSLSKRWIAWLATDTFVAVLSMVSSALS